METPATTPHPEPLAEPAAADGADDALLVERVRGGDLAAFELLMRRHNQKLFRAVRAVLRDRVEIEDVMQETYLSAFKHLEQFEGRATFATWLLKIGIHEAFARLRRRVPVVAIDDSTAEGAAMHTMPIRNPEEQAAQNQLIDIVEAALDRLPTEHRQILVLRGVEALDTAEVAEVLGLSEAAVKQRLHRARVLLQGAVAGQVDGALSAAFGFLGSQCDRVVANVMRALVSVPLVGACADCGAFSELRFADQFMCEACYVARGSCCTEFSDDPQS
ncbi:MAG TPA: RNA polymerase sigma factor [Polyangia bacterium]